MDKFTEWFFRQPKHIQDDLKQNHPVWFDRDMYTAFFLGIMMGIIVTLLAGY
jgi:hypothetical protein